MPAVPITVRNLTATPIRLKLVERYKALSLQDGSGGLGFIGRNLTYFGLSKTTHPSATQLAATVEEFVNQEFDLSIEPFATKQTDITAPENAFGETVRLTFEVDGQRYRIDTPSPREASQSFTSLSAQPKHEFTGIYLPEETFLAVYSSAQLNCWMKNLHDATPLSALSIPGTHNTPTYHKALPSVRCQSVNPRIQLDNGIRFFDIRVQPESLTSPNLALVHAVFPVSLTGTRYFHDVLKRVYAFLDHNPSETLIMSIKREGIGACTDQQLGHSLHDHYTEGRDAHRWYTDPRIPTLGQVRGKIILMRRFCIDESMQKSHDGRGWAIDAQSWVDNTPHDVHGSVCVQDFYEVLETVNITKKISYCEAHLDRAASCIAMLPGITTDATHPVPPQPFYLNFLSASNFFNMGCWPDRIAAKMNPAMISWICRNHARATHGDGGTGIVVCDFMGASGNWNLVRCIVGFNSKLMIREMAL